MQQSILATSYFIDQQINRTSIIVMEDKKKNGNNEEIISLRMRRNYHENEHKNTKEIDFQENLLPNTNHNKDEETEIAQMIEKANKQQDKHSSVFDELSNEEYTRVLKQLNYAKEQINSLNLEMASATNTKLNAEKENYIEEIKKEIEQAKIEQALLDTNRLIIDAETREIEALRFSEAANYTRRMRETTTKIDELHRELNSTKDIKQNLCNTASDLNVLQSEMELIRAMEKSVPEPNAPRTDTKSLLNSVKEELEAANELLRDLKGESFRLMNEVDALRKDLSSVSEQKENSSKVRKLSDSKLSGLNMNLHVALTELESASESKKRAQSIASNLCAALDQLNRDIGGTKRDTQLVHEEIEAIKEHTKRINRRNASSQKKFEAAMGELSKAEALESSELKKLSLATESTMNERAIVSVFSDTVTISEFEYLYLAKQGKAAEEIAELKVDAAKTWLESFSEEKKAKELERRMGLAVVPYEEKKLSSRAEGLGSKKEKRKLLGLIGFKSRRERVKFVGYKEEEECAYSLKTKLAIAMPERSLNVNGLSEESERREMRRSSVTARTRR